MGRQKIANADTDESSEDESAQDTRSLSLLRGFLASPMTVIIVYFLVGAFWLHTVEKFGFITSFYVITQIVTTIGYGDVTVTTAASEWFMIFYVFVGLCIIANLMTDFLNQGIELVGSAWRSKIRDFEASLDDEVSDADQAKRKYGERNNLIVSIGLYVFFIVIGVVFYSKFEACSCSYGESHKEGCVADTKETCIATGGYTKNFRQSLYMAVITMSTTGFGDYAPKSRWGRIFGIPWMCLGVVAAVNMISQLSLFWLRETKGQQQRIQLAEQDFDVIDADKNGHLTLAEFRTFLLLREGIITEADIAGMDKLFARLDRKGDGVVTRDEYLYAFDHSNQYDQLERDATGLVYSATPS